MELVYKQQGNDNKLKLMTTILERFKALVAYFLTFSFQVLCIISEKNESSCVSDIGFHCVKSVRIGLILVRIPRISPCSLRMRENADRNNSEYGHFSGSVYGCNRLNFNLLVYISFS